MGAVYVLIIAIPVWLLLVAVAVVPGDRQWLNPSTAMSIGYILLPFAIVALCVYGAFCGPQVGPISSPSLR
jgi:hypothetical protein